MMHSSHSHHTHHHSMELKNVSNAFIIGIILNFLFVIIEALVGLSIHSLSLLSDAGHNLADVATLALSLLAIKLLQVKSSKDYTYGYRKTSILVALFNASVLLVTIGAIIYEALHRFLNPEPIQGATIAIVAGVGIIINGITALLFLRTKDKDINVKSAYLHLMSDALVSLGIVIGGIVMYYTHWFWLDSVLSIVIALVILLSTWKLLKQSIRLSLDGIPDDINLDDVTQSVLKTKGVVAMHHLHIWAISSTENALTAHVVLEQTRTIEEEYAIKNNIKHLLKEKNIHHVTIETERENNLCETSIC